MGWKYVMFKGRLPGGTAIQFPVIFPDKLIHSEVAAVLKLCAPLEACGARPVSAGKIEHVVVEGLGGDSETLKLKARASDAEVVATYSYVHGLSFDPPTGR